MFSALRLAFRTLGRTPGFTTVALITLALGIGVNSSMYTLVDVLLFRSAPYPESDQLMFVQARNAQGQSDGFSFREFEEMRNDLAATAAGGAPDAASRPFATLIAFSQWNNAYAEPGQPAERLFSADCTADFFATFRVQPFLGRAFSPAEQVPGHNQVALLSHALWQSRFGGDPAVVGRTIRLNAEQVTIIGVMPATFTYPLFWGKIDLWRPITIPQHIVSDRDNRLFGIVARLNPGFTAATAEAHLKPLLARWAQDYPKNNAGRGARVMTLTEATLDSTGRFLVWLLAGIGLVVLFIACFNLANLQLARAATSTRDLAIRSALGASRASLIRHQLTESLVLAVAGGVLGLLVGSLTNTLLGHAIRLGDAGSLELTMNAPVLLATFGLSLASGVLFGLFPAWIASQGRIVDLLKQQSRGSTSGSGTHRFRHALIVAQVAMALALLATAGVMVRGFDAMLNRPKGWDVDRVLAANIHLPEQSTYNTDEKRRAVHEKLIQRLRQIPQAESTAICSTTPLFGYSKTAPIEVQGQTSDDPAKQPLGGFTMVGSDYFATLGIPLREGRLFPAELKAENPPLVVINESMARHFWPDRSAIGRRVGERVGDQVIWREVIGVVADTSFALELSPPPTRFHIYKPMVNEPWGYMFLLARHRSPATLKNELRRAVADVDADVAVQDMYTIPEAMARFGNNLRVINNTVAGFALLGLLLAGIGLYGVISNLVAQRTNEFGIRLALGAQPRAVQTLVLRLGLWLSLLGLVVGSVLAFALNRALRSSLPGMTANDPLTIGGVALLLFAVTLFACWLPALRATRINPLDALRGD